MALLSLLLLAIVASAMPPHTHVLLPLKTRRIASRFHGFERYFSKYIPVLSSAFDGSRGVQVVATERVPDDKVERVANVLAEFLDNDEDGWLDNPDVAIEMERHGATMIMFADGDELEQSGFDGVPGFDDQDVEGDETGSPPSMHAHVMTTALVDRSLVCKNRPELICDAPLEEVFHLVTNTGFAMAYPKQFATKPGSSLSVSMDGVIGNCGYASPSNPFGRYSTFRFPNCTGKYHYGDDTCDYRCLATEYIHHFVASYNGEYPWGRGEVCGNMKRRGEEWELCADAPNGDLNKSRELLKDGDPDFFAMFTDPFYKLPLIMPDGNYTPRNEPPRKSRDQLQSLEDHLGVLAVTGFKRIVLQSSLRRMYRARVVANSAAPDANTLGGAASVVV